MPTDITTQKMKEIAEFIEASLPGRSFGLVAFDPHDGVRLLKYISNNSRQDMIQTYEALLKILGNATLDHN